MKSFSLITALCLATMTAGFAQEESQILTVENKVWCNPANDPVRKAAKAGQTLRIHDRLQTEKDSRASVRLGDRSVLRVNELTVFELLPPREKDRKPLLSLKAGSLYFFSREKPSDVEFRTPTAAGAIRGTEFMLSVSTNGETRVELIDGAVDLGNEAGQVQLRSGEQASVAKGQAPSKSALLDAINVIQWCLYYPAVLDPSEVQTKDDLHKSLAAYRAGDLLGALAALPADSDPVYHAALLLGVGRVDDAQKLLGDLPATPLRRLIAAVQLKDAPAAAPPATASEWLAESYDRQAHGKLDAALDAARRALTRSPHFGFAAVRVAELEFSFGRVAAARAVLETGLKDSPRNAQGLALRGFIAAAQDQPQEALQAFDAAIAIDGAFGNAWLGRGLVRIRLGQHAAGRQDLQTAAALEPNRALLRCYLGKAWSLEGQPELADKDLRLARQLDPNDPTAWLYSALLNQQRNRINEAIRELEKSQDLNDNQVLFRSQLLLDQDRAVRSANLAAVYRDAGMEDVSLREAGKAVNADYASAASHLFLANSYDLTRDPKLFNLRYEAPARREWLIGTLLAPVGASSLSRNMSYQDYVRLFEQDGFGLSGAAEYRSHGEWTQNATQYGREGAFAYALDDSYRTDRGQRANNDQEQLQLTGQFKYELTPQDNVLLFVEYFRQESGDVAQYYNPNSANPGLRVTETQEPNLYAGYHREWSPGSHSLLLVGRIQDSLHVKNPDTQPLYVHFTPTGTVDRVIQQPDMALDYERDYQVFTVEAQHILELHPHSIIVGGSYQTGAADTDAMLTQFGNSRSDQQLDLDLDRLTAYGYYEWRVIDPLALTGGVTFDQLRYPENALNAPLSQREKSVDQVSPKAGVIFTPGQHTTVRALYSQSLGGLFNEDSFRLEPTQVAGLNQSYRSMIPESAGGLLPAAKMENYSASLDQSFTSGTFLGIAAQWLNSHGARGEGVFTNAFFVPLVLPDLYATTRQTLEYREKSVAVTANQLLGDEWSVGARYQVSQADLQCEYPDLPDSALWQVSKPKSLDVAATLQQVTLSVNYNHRCGFFGQLRSQWSQQTNDGYTPALAGEDFWQHDLLAGYRFPQRRLEVHLGVLNLTDQGYRLNPLNLYAELPRARTLVAGAKFHF